VCATLGATVTVVLVWALMTQWGLLGAAYGLLGGSASGSIARWMAFQRIVMVDRSTWISPMVRRAASTRDV
jgi:O-antigen/teichoic acid export membrane protein